MSLMDQYANVFQLANQVGLENPVVTEQGGKLHLKGITEYETGKNLL